MPNYSTDENLIPVYVSDAAALPDSLAPLHEEATAQINRDLYAKDWDDASLAILTPASLLELVKPACCYVMYLLSRMQVAHERGTESLDKAKFWRDEYRRALESALIETTAEDDGVPPETSRGYVVLG